MTEHMDQKGKTKLHLGDFKNFQNSFKIHLHSNYTFKAIAFQQPPSLWNPLEAKDVPHGLNLPEPRPHTSAFSQGPEDLL